MSEFDDKISEMLNDPHMLSEIMTLASAIQGGGAEASPPESAVSGVNPEMIAKMMRLFSEFSKDDKEKTALLYAIKPYLNKKRQEKFKDALSVMKLARILPHIKKEGFF